MLIIEAMLVAALLGLTAYATVCDFKRSIVPNKAIVIAGVLVLVLAVVYNLFFVQDSLSVYLLNVMVSALLSVLLFGFHIWGGGDSKLLLVIAVGYPLRFYFPNVGTRFALINLFALVFAISFIYLVADSVYMIVKRRSSLITTAKMSIRTVVVEYFIGLAYATIISAVIRFALGRILQNSTMVCAFIIFFALSLVSGFGWYRKRAILIPVCIFALPLFVYGCIASLQSNLLIYPLSAVVIIVRRVIERFNYEVIEPSELKPGMLLSMASVHKMQASRIHNIPRYMSENLKNKLSPLEVEATQKWFAKNPGEQLVIARKVPFAVFIFAGTVVYLMMGVTRLVIQ